MAAIAICLLREFLKLGGNAALKATTAKGRLGIEPTDLWVEGLIYY